jgi:hypothetical protein
MSEVSPQTTTGDPVSKSPNDGSGWRNNRKNKHGQESQDKEEIPAALRSYRYDTGNSNLAETFERITQEIAQYIATKVQGAGYMRRAIMDLQEPTI